MEKMKHLIENRLSQESRKNDWWSQVFCLISKSFWSFNSFELLACVCACGWCIYVYNTLTQIIISFSYHENGKFRKLNVQNTPQKKCVSDTPWTRSRVLLSDDFRRQALICLLPVPVKRLINTPVENDWTHESIRKKYCLLKKSRLSLIPFPTNRLTILAR